MILGSQADEPLREFHSLLIIGLLRTGPIELYFHFCGIAVLVGGGLWLAAGAGDGGSWIWIEEGAGDGGGSCELPELALFGERCHR